MSNLSPYPHRMPGIVQVLFPEPPLVRSPMRLLRWWESHRLTYNLVVGGAGLISLGVAAVLQAMIAPPGHVFIPWQAVVAYGVLANLCYSGGWVAETVLQKWLGRATYGLGPALYRHGLVFSVGLTLLPAGLWTVGIVAHVLGIAH